MALYKTTDIPADTDVYVRKNNEKLFLNSTDEYISKKLDNIEFGSTMPEIHFSNSSRFALHDLALYCAKRIGISDVYFCSFNISGKAARLIQTATDNHYFSKVSLVLNKQKCPQFAKYTNLIKNFCKIRYTNVHAKFAIVKSKDCELLIVFSGNLSNNTNHEVGFISADRMLIIFYQKLWLQLTAEN